jgi:drug/metabolite transporter (DMT)-like permease
MNVIATLIKGRSAQMTLAISYILIATMASATGQILLKLGMARMGPLTLSFDQLAAILWKIGTNPFVILGLAIYVGGTVFWLSALSRVDLSYAYPFASLSYIVMLIASWQLFNENISPLRLLGTFVVCVGVILISRS